MEFRSAFPVAVLLGGMLGAAAVALDAPTASPSSAAPSLDGIAVDAAAPAARRVRWDIPVVRNAPVERFVRLFTHKQQDRMALYLKRSGRYEGMIRGKLRARGMPEDLVYLSMIESGFNPTARSRAQAVGLWQFIAGTARDYGLRVDAYVDERRDPEKSTDAALRYLRDLHNEFGAWYLAAAAYNTGGGRVSRVMREETGRVRGVEADFWRIRHRLPAETREYVPLMLAAALIGKEPQRYGLGGVKRWLPLEVETVQVPGGTELEVVARAVGATERELERLNPQLIKQMTPPGSRAYPVRVPRGSRGLFAARFAGLHQQAVERARVERAREQQVVKARQAEARRVAARSRSHTVRRGESLWTIARRHDTSVAALKRANGMGSRSTIRPGQRLRLPS
ncbi:MAG TPA: transglycosylase SLT domain-containing protein [Longimicrobiaceae bacterium]|nr:transglycosylase SLT domain-containing protein [Longimicrobiaceae bacterium]